MADPLPQIAVGVNFIVEARCPHCQNLNKYQQLTAVHTNLKNHLKKSQALAMEGVKSPEPSLDARCESCDKWFKIARALYM